MRKKFFQSGKTFHFYDGFYTSEWTPPNSEQWTLFFGPMMKKTCIMNICKMHVMQNSSEFCFLLYYTYSDSPFHADSEYHLFSPEIPLFRGENLKILKRVAKPQIFSFSKKTFYRFSTSWFRDSSFLYLDSLYKTEYGESVFKPSELKVKIRKSAKRLKTPCSRTSVYKPYSFFLWTAKTLIHTSLDRPSNELQKYGEFFLKFLFLAEKIHFFEISDKKIKNCTCMSTFWLLKIRFCMK